MIGCQYISMNKSVTSTILAWALSATLLYAQGTPDGNTPSAPPAVQQNEAAFQPLQKDPQLLEGKLENGLSYMIRPTKEPAGRGSVRLYVATGSLDETEETSGISHFLEHMVFNGSRTFKRGELIPTMQKLGLGFGGDANAYTSLLQTVYMLDLPNLEDETVNFALTIMRDFADGATLEDDAIDHERGIVVSELKARDSESYRSAINMIRQMTEGARVADFMPIGKEEIIRNASYDTVRQYYREKYVPERMTLIITGDFDPSTAEKWVHQHFDSLEKRPNPPRPAIGELTNLGPTESIRPNREQAPVTIAASVVRPYEAKADTLEQRIEDLPLELATGMLNMRLSRIAQRADSPFLQAGIDTSNIFDTAESFGFMTTAAPDKWQAALARTEQELRSAIQYGFEPHELQEVAAGIIASLTQASESWETISADNMATGLVSALSNRTTPTTPKEDLRAIELGLERVLSNPDLCRQALEKKWNAPNAKLNMTGSIPEGVTPASLRQTFNDSLATNVQKPELQKAKPFAYDNIGTPGQIIQKEQLDDIGVTTLTLSNGIKVNLKPLEFKKGGLTVMAAIDGGALQLPKKPGLAMAASSVMSLSGLEAHDIDELKRIMLGHNVDLNFGMGDTRFTISGGTTQEDLELECKLIIAGIMHPGYKQDALLRLHRNLPATYRKMATTPQGAYAMQSARALYGNDVRFTIPTQEEVEQVTLEDVRNAIDPHLQKGAIEVTLVGDFDLEKTLPIIEKTFGAMPPRNKEFTPIAPEQRQVNIQPWGQKRFFRYPTQLDKTIVTQVRPAGDGMDKHRNRRLQVLASIVREKLFDGIRAAMGESYSPTVRLELNPEFENAASIATASAGVKGNRQKVNAAMETILNGIGQGQISQEDFECAIRPIIASTEKDLRTGSFWCSNLIDLQSSPDRLTLLRDLKEDLQSITYEEIKALGIEIFGKDNANFYFTVPQDNQTEESSQDSPPPTTPPASPAKQLNYTVLTTETTAADPAWRKVAETLAAKYEGAKLIVIPTLDEENCVQALRSASARYAAIVLKPEEIGRDSTNALHRAARKIDDDPWGDCIWGYVTGYSAADAQRIADTRDPLIIKRLLATTNVSSAPFEHSYCITDWTGFPVLEQTGYRQPTQTTYTTKTPEGKDVLENGIQSRFAEQLSDKAPQIIITSSHATQYNLEMPFSKGLIFPADNRFYQLPLPQMREFGPVLAQAMNGQSGAMRLLAKTLNAQEIKPDNTPRVWLAAGNCLLGDAAHTNQSMAVTALSSYTCNQLIGYTVPSWYGAGGWGTLSTFFDNTDGTTLAEAWFLNNQFILHDTLSISPELLSIRFDRAEIDSQLQREVINQLPKVSISKAKDAIGLVHDRDTVAFYGDPAWAASIDTAHSARPFHIEWTGEKSFTITANSDSKRRCAVWFPTAATGAGATGCDAKGAIFTNDFILFPELELKKGESLTVTIK